MADAHLRAGTFGAKGKGDAFIRLNIQHQAVGFDLAFAKHNMRRAMKLNDNLGAAFRQPFPGAQIKGNARPAPIIDQELHGDEGVRAGMRIDARFLTVSRNGLALDHSRPILPAHHRLRNHSQIERAYGLQNF